MTHETGLAEGNARMGNIWLACGVASLGFAGATALAEPPPKRLDQALTDVLALGNAAGCSEAFGLPNLNNEELDELLRDLRERGELEEEVAAICGSSAVNSAAALGGSLGSLQTTKTVSQFRLARRRVDSRLNLRGKRFGFGGSLMLAALDQPSLPRAGGVIGPDATREGGYGVFVQGEHERRDRAITVLESGYEAKLSSGLIGFDYVTQNGFLAGGWVGYGSTSADYTGANLLVGSPTASIDTSGLRTSLDSALIADVCKLSPGGKFDDEGGKLGGFFGARLGAGFADLALQYSRRDYGYRRNVCTIETTDSIARDPGVGSGFKQGDGDILDDIYAGTISGKARLTEWSVSARAGYDFGGERWLWGPRVSLTYAKSKIDAFTESGRTSVTNAVESVTNILKTLRASGDPTGLELAFGDQSRTSLQSEFQFVAAYRFEPAFGAIIPRFSASWIHEFEGERELVTVQMAQDRRATPTRFTFTTDSADKDKGVIALGVTALRGERFAADFEIAHLLADDRFDSTSITAQARWRF